MMTIHYGDEKLYQLFLRWRGSVWKMVYKELIVFLVCFHILDLIYRYGLDEYQRNTFGKVVKHVEDYRKAYLPVSFLLGFYVAIMVNRWWKQFELIPWPDRVIAGIAFNINGKDKKSIFVRSTISRYLNLSFVLAFRDLSTGVRKRFPTFDHLEKAGLITEIEHEQLKKHEAILSQHDEIVWIIPIEWSQRILEQLVQEKLIAGPQITYTLKQLHDYQANFKKLYQYAWANLPLVYTHVAAIAVYMNFALAIVGQQFVNKQLDYYIPVITLIEMMFYIGWFKVGCELMVPYGEDDNNFDLNFFIDRHWTASEFFSKQVREFVPNITPHESEAIQSQTYKPLPHTVISAQVPYDQVKLPAKIKFDQIYNLEYCPLFAFETPKEGKEESSKKCNELQNSKFTNIK